MLKAIMITSLVFAAMISFGQDQKHQDKDTVTHAINHAGHWVSRHVNAPHKTHRRRHSKAWYRKHHKDTVGHAVNHAGNWISHHVNAPHH